MAQTDNAIEIQGVSKHFGSVKALQNVDLKATRGKVTGLLGPNGAGKTTLIKVMATLLQPDGGQVQVDGVDVLHSAAKARRRIGLAGQFAAVDDFLTGRETLEMVGRLYHLPKKEVKKKAQDLLDRLGLDEAADRQTKTYSGGMRRRLDLGASLVATPNVLFLDEPTTGLDPRTRFQLWDIIRELIKQGVTILLTTQYLEEADALADYLYVIDHGRMIAEGTAEQLKGSLGQDVIELKVAENQLIEARQVLSDSLKRKVEVDELTRRVRLRTKNGSDDLLAAASALKQAKIKAEELSVHRPSLDDVFLAITGKKPEEENNAGN
ncbi:ATP-binding cassette domain-containing protein [Candidatus Saccharibacteria bacterium]|nr:ATP-binding cassette domain-containing protein [Candidatus Saccharibacteria bacterium]